MSRTAMLVNDLINKGQITIGEAKAELKDIGLQDAAEVLAGWILDRYDQGDDWKAGDPVRLPDGQVVAYADEHNWAPGRNGAWVRTDPDRRNQDAWIEFPAGSYNGGL